MKERKELSVGETREEAIESFPQYNEGLHELVCCDETDLWQIFHRRKQHDPTIRKPLHRVTRSDFRHYRRKIVVGMLPGDLFSFRLKGTRKVTYVEIATVYQMALHREAFAAMNLKRAAKAKRKKERGTKR